MILRCKLDQLMLLALRHPKRPTLVLCEGDEEFELERVEATFYELVAATEDELLWLQTVGYRLLTRADEFELMAERIRV